MYIGGDQRFYNINTQPNVIVISGCGVGDYHIIIKVIVFIIVFVLVYHTDWLAKFYVSY